MAHFDIPLDLPHAGRLAERILSLLERTAEERGLDVPGVLDTADRLSSALLKYSFDEDNPPPDEADRVRNEAALLGRALVEEIEAADIGSDRIGQFIRNLFECLELGAEGAEISLRAGENPGSLQRPV